MTLERMLQEQGVIEVPREDLAELETALKVSDQQKKLDWLYDSVMDLELSRVETIHIICVEDIEQLNSMYYMEVVLPSLVF